MDRKIILVTGATSGIGEATARRLAALKHTVILTGRNRDKIEEMERSMASVGQRVVGLAGDLTREEDARFVASEALKTFGTVHVLVHSAGIFKLSRAEKTGAEEFRQVLDTNLTSLQHLLSYLLPHFYKEGSGHVVAISSVAGRLAFPLETAYCSSKWGLMGYLGALRMEAAERGVRVTAILPGPTLTPEWDGSDGAFDRDKMLTALNVAEAVSFAVGQPENACIEEILIMPSRDPFGGARKERMNPPQQGGDPNQALGGNERQDRNVVAEAPRHDEQMPDGVIVGNLSVARIKENASRIGQAAQTEPDKDGQRHSRKQWLDGDDHEPAHEDVENGGDDGETAQEKGFQDDPRKGQAPDHPEEAPAPGPAGGRRA